LSRDFTLIGYAMTTMQYVDRFLDPLGEVFTPEVAQKLIDLRAAPELQARIDELAEKANEGLLTPAEDDEYKNLIDAGDIVAILQAKARQFLANTSP
jgi:hypothetical protein